MSTPSLPNPPNPGDYVYQNPAIDGQRLLNRAVYEWMLSVKGTLEIALKQSIRPAGQPIVVGAFTTNTTVASPSVGVGTFTVTTSGTNTFATGTVTSTDLANAVCSIAQAMTMRGFLTPKVGQ